MWNSIVLVPEYCLFIYLKKKPKDISPGSATIKIGSLHPAPSGKVVKT